MLRAKLTLHNSVASSPEDFGKSFGLYAFFLNVLSKVFASTSMGSLEL
jgi:hypothetical protein